MTRPLSLSFTALCVFTCLSCAAQAQELVPIFQLSAEEIAKANHLAQDLKNAHERSDKAELAWRVFHQTYQAAHPDWPIVHFTGDFRLAFALSNPTSLLDSEVRRVTSVELTAKEQQQLKALHQERAESQQSLQQAEKNWKDYQYQLAADHFPSKEANGTMKVTLESGKQVVIPIPWQNGLAFTPDFRFAVPRTP
jgi:hypothetical protein